MTICTDAAGIVLVSILFLWQIPHFVAIALFRKADYTRAGLVVTPSPLDPCESDEPERDPWSGHPLPDEVVPLSESSPHAATPSAPRRTANETSEARILDVIEGS